jgi:hypothetical protein
VRNEIQPTRYKVTDLDVAMVENWTLVAMGPIDHGGVEGVRAALRTIASAGPHARVGLIPSSRTRNWVFEPDSLQRGVHEIPAVHTQDLPATLAAAVRLADVSLPIAVTVCGRYLIVRLAHGVGDGQTTVNLTRALADPATRTGKVPQWCTALQPTRFPLTAASWNLYASSPGKLLRSVTAGRPKEVSSQPITAKWQPSHHVGFATSSPTALGDLAAWRKANAVPASLSSIFFASIVRALREEGIKVDNTVKVLFDARRYLPENHRTLSNFAAGLDLSFDDAGSPASVGDGISAAADSGRPLLNLAATSVKSRLGRITRRPVGDAVTSAPAHPRARIAYSDMSGAPQFKNFPLTGTPKESVYIATLLPESPEHIVIAVGRLGTLNNVSFSFHDNVFDAERIGSAFENACKNPLKFFREGIAE